MRALYDSGPRPHLVLTSEDSVFHCGVAGWVSEWQWWVWVSDLFWKRGLEALNKCAYHLNVGDEWWTLVLVAFLFAAEFFLKCVDAATSNLGIKVFVIPSVQLFFHFIRAPTKFF